MNSVLAKGISYEMTGKDIQKLEKIFQKSIEDYNRLNPDGPYHLESKNYKRQYVPMINSKGEKEVWVNCFCVTRGDEWKTEIVYVEDGGDCFFNLQINLSKESYSEFRVNGEA